MLPLALQEKDEQLTEVARSRGEAASVRLALTEQVEDLTGRLNAANERVRELREQMRNVTAATAAAQVRAGHVGGRW